MIRVRVITEGRGNVCDLCHSTSHRSGFLGLFGELLCDNNTYPNSNKLLKKLKNISKKYGIKNFEKVEKGDYLCKVNGESNYVNRSVIIGNDTIQIGIYDDIEHMIISFFHEIGHIYNIKNNMINSEPVAWIYALYLANENNFRFKQSTYEWVIKQLNTYNI